MCKRLSLLLAFTLGISLAMAAPSLATTSHRLTTLPRLCRSFRWHGERIYATPVGATCKTAARIGHAVAKKHFLFSNPHKFDHYTCHTSDSAQAYTGHLVDCERGRRGVTIDRIVRSHTPNVGCSSEEMRRASAQELQAGRVKLKRFLCINSVAIAQVRPKGDAATGHDAYVILVPSGKTWYGETNTAALKDESIKNRLEDYSFSLASYYRLHHYFMAHKLAGRI